MRDITRQGIYRIIYDVVKADTLISSAEIGYLKKMCDLYDITPEYRESAMNMSLATAMAEIKTMPVRQAATFIEELQQLSLSDVYVVGKKRCFSSPSRPVSQEIRREKSFPYLVVTCHLMMTRCCSWRMVLIHRSTTI